MTGPPRSQSCFCRTTVDYFLRHGRILFIRYLYGFMRVTVIGEPFRFSHQAKRDLLTELIPLVRCALVSRLIRRPSILGKRCRHVVDYAEEAIGVYMRGVRRLLKQFNNLAENAGSTLEVMSAGRFPNDYLP